MEQNQNGEVEGATASGRTEESQVEETGVDIVAGYPSDNIKRPLLNSADTLDPLEEMESPMPKGKHNLQQVEEATASGGAEESQVEETGVDLVAGYLEEDIRSPTSNTEYTLDQLEEMESQMTNEKHNLSELEGLEGRNTESEICESEENVLEETERSDSPAFDEASDQVFDYVCCSCEVGGKNVEAEQYCQECAECYCQACLESHDRFPAFRNHMAIGQTEKARWAQTTPAASNVSLEKCGSHPTENVTMFCDKHQELCCHVCVALDHKACTTMKYIPELAVGIFTSKDLDVTQQSAATVKKDLEKLKGKRQTSQIDLANSKLNILAQLKTSRKTLMKKYNAVEAKVMDEITKQNAHGSKTLHNDIAQCEKEVMDLEKSAALIDKSQGKTEAQMFIHMKRCEQRIIEASKVLQDSSFETHEFKIVFKPNPELETFLETFASLGTVETVQASHAKAQQTKTQQQQSSASTTSKLDAKTPEALFVAPKANLKTKKLKLLTTKNRRSVTTKVKKDKSACWISGLCQIPGAGFILADNLNNRLKYLSSSSLSVTECCDLLSAPRDVCCISQQEVAVSMSNQTIRFFSVTSKSTFGKFLSGSSKTLEESRSFKTDHQCYGIAYFEDKLYVSDKETMVVVYNLAGKCLNVIEKDSSGVSMFSKTRHLAVSHDGVRLHVADFEKGLVTVLLQNNTHVVATDDKVKGARGVCVSKSGRIFVTGKNSSNVMQVDPSGMVVCGIVDANMRVPGSVCVDKDDIMLVSINPGAGCDNMNVADLK